MGKVDWINWKTDAKEIINPSILEDSILDCFQDFNTIMNPIIYEQLKYEMISGGLSEDTLIVDGSSPANKASKEIIEMIDQLKEEMNLLKQEMVNTSKEQKKIEKEQLIEAIQDKIDIEKVYLDNVLNNTLMNYDNGTSREELEDIIRDRINKLQERLDCVKAL